MGEIKISVSDKLDGILQKMADGIGIKKAELVKNIVVKELMDREEKKR
jgi:hypothetical protein